MAKKKLEEYEAYTDELEEEIDEYDDEFEELDFSKPRFSRSHDSDD